MDKLIVYEPMGKSNAHIVVLFEVETFLRQVRIDLMTTRWLNVPMGTEFEIEVALKRKAKLRFTGNFVLEQSRSFMKGSQMQFNYHFISQGAPSGFLPNQYAEFDVSEVAVS